MPPTPHPPPPPNVRSVLFIHAGTYAPVGGVETVTDTLSDYLRSRGVSVARVGLRADLPSDDPRQNAEGVIPFAATRVDPVLPRETGAKGAPHKAKPRAAGSRATRLLLRVPRSVQARTRRYVRTRKSVATRDLPRRKAKKFDRILAAEPQPLCVVCIEPETALFAAKARERLGANFPIVLAVHNDPRYLLERKGGPSLCLERLAKQGTLDSVIVLDDDYTRPFTRMGFHDVRTIRNPSPNLVPASDLPSRLPKEAAMMGSLVGRKNVAAAIRVWSEVVKRRPGWTLRVYGTGYEESELRHLTESLGIDGFVRFEGDTSEPQEALARAQFLLHTSVLEGWPMVIVEAASVGTPTVAFEASAGVRTLVRDSGAGMLVPLGDESALRDAILSVIDDEKHRQQLGERATMVSAQYPLEEIGTSWIETFDRLIEQRRLRKGV